MLKSTIFREYDIRGVVGKDLTEATVYDVARAIGTFYKANGARRVSLGRDARESSPLFRDLLVRRLVENLGRGRDFLNLFLLCRHDPLQRRVANLADARLNC